MSDGTHEYGSKGTFPATQSQVRNSIGKGENTLQAILCGLRVRAEFNWVLPTDDVDGQNRRIYLKPDAHVFGDKIYLDGVIEVDGDEHRKLSTQKWDDKKDAYCAKLGLWVGRIAPELVNKDSVKAMLEGHRRDGTTPERRQGQG